jgi:tetratricopeptide (TPR) repeat protein
MSPVRACSRGIGDLVRLRNYKPKSSVFPMSTVPVPASGIEGEISKTGRLIAAGKLDEARSASDAILSRNPHHPGALIQRSRLESVEDNYRQGREYALAAYRAGIQNKRQCLLLLRRLRTFNLTRELLDLVEKLPDSLALDPDVAKLVAILLESVHQSRAALAFSSRAAKYNPASADLHAAVGVAELYMGRLDAAQESLQECLRLDPGHGSAWWHLVRLRKQDAGSNHVDELRRVLARATDHRVAALLAYSLHKELDDLGDYSQATDALERACASMRKAVRYSLADDAALFAALKDLPSADAGQAAADVDPFTPVFIVGMHRSGTTLLEQFLAGHDQVCAAGELYDFTSQLRFAADHHCRTELDLRIVQASDGFDYRAIGRGYLESVDWRRAPGQSLVVDKLPSNFLNLGFILRALPNARILHMSRDPMETCFSNLREPFSENACRYSYDQGELGEYYRNYFSLMQHWRKRFPERILDVTYMALVTDPASELKRVANHLGIGFQPSMLDIGSSTRNVTTASAVQVRQKVGLSEQPKWLPYREYLTPLSWRLSDLGQRY